MQFAVGPQTLTGSVVSFGVNKTRLDEIQNKGKGINNNVLTVYSSGSELLFGISVGDQSGTYADLHWGRWRKVDSRELVMKKHGFAKGADIVNLRSWSGVSAEDLEKISQNLGVQNPIPSGAFMENIVFSGIPNFSKLPPGTLIFFKDHDGKTRDLVLRVEQENHPCGKTAESLKLYPGYESVTPANFAEAARGLRGVVGTIYSRGSAMVGDTVVVEVPEQTLYCA